MRKCPSCGSLLLGDVDTCARCGAALAQVPPIGAPVSVGAAPVAAPSPSWPPAPTSPAGPPAAPGVVSPSGPGSSSGPVTGLGRLSIPSPVPAPPPTDAAAQSSEFRESWQPMQILAPPAPQRSKAWGWVALATAIVLVLGAAVLHLHADPLPAGTSAFVSGGGVTYTSADLAFQVQMPENPQATSETININGAPVNVYVATIENDNYEMVAASFTLPQTVSAQRVADALDQVMTAGIAGMKGTVEHKSLTTHATLPAVEGGFKLSDGYQARLLAVASSTSLILVGVHAKSGTDRLFKALEDSLIVR